MNVHIPCASRGRPSIVFCFIHDIPVTDYTGPLMAALGSPSGMPAGEISDVRRILDDATEAGLDIIESALRAGVSFDGVTCRQSPAGRAFFWSLVGHKRMASRRYTAMVRSDPDEANAFRQAIFETLESIRTTPYMDFRRRCAAIGQSDDADGLEVIPRMPGRRVEVAKRPDDLPVNPAFPVGSLRDGAAVVIEAFIAGLRPTVS